MFARSIIFRQTHSDVMAKTAQYSKGAMGGTVSSLACFGVAIAVTLGGFGLNRAYPSTRHVSESYAYGGVDQAKSQGKL